MQNSNQIEVVVELGNWKLLWWITKSLNVTKNTPFILTFLSITSNMFSLMMINVVPKTKLSEYFCLIYFSSATANIFYQNGIISFKLSMHFIMSCYLIMGNEIQICKISLPELICWRVIISIVYNIVKGWSKSKLSNY